MSAVQRISRLFAIAALCASGSVISQSFPTKPVRMIISGAPGGSNDTVARPVAQKLSERWGQPVVVETHNGANGGVAVGVIARAKPDGYVLGVLGGSTLVTMTVSKARDDLDFQTSMAPVSQLVEQDFVLVVNPAVPAKSLREFIEFAKSKPGALNYGSLGENSTTHLGMELLGSLVGADMTHVPYKSTPQVTADLLSGRIHALFGGALSVGPQVKAGKFRPLAVSSDKRSALFPDLPTISEAGVPGFRLVTWFALMAPAGTPSGLVQSIHRDAVDVMSTPELRQFFAKAGTEVSTSASPAELKAMIDQEVKLWDAFAKKRQK